jgi:ribosomal protein L11 methyltransferase
MREERVWLALEVRTAASAAEAVEFALGELEALGTYYGLRAKPEDEAVVVTGYFHERIPDEIVLGRLNESLKIYGFEPEAVSGTDWKTVEDRDWMAEWKKQWKPTVTEKFVVAPPWDEGVYEGKFIIRIEPGMAFGTGTHETTRLCLREIERRFEPGMSFLDVGTGTGILAIAAALVSGDASRIAGCDTDADALEIAVENAGSNGVGGIELRIGPIDADTPAADFVCANLTAGAILPILPLLVEKANSILVLSGVLVEQKDKVGAELSRLGYPGPRIETDGEWISLTVLKKP